MNRQGVFTQGSSSTSSMPQPTLSPSGGQQRRCPTNVHVNGVGAVFGTDLSVSSNQKQAQFENSYRGPVVVTGLQSSGISQGAVTSHNAVTPHRPNAVTPQNIVFPRESMYGGATNVQTVASDGYDDTRHDDEKGMSTEDPEPKSGRKTATKTCCIILIVLFVLLAIALVVGLVLGLDRDDDANVIEETPEEEEEIPQ